MTKTNYARKIDSLGRLVIPSKLREEYGIDLGETYDFYTIEVDGEMYLGIKCPKSNPKVEEAKQILRDAGYTI